MGVHDRLVQLLVRVLPRHVVGCESMLLGKRGRDGGRGLHLVVEMNVAKVGWVEQKSKGDMVRRNVTGESANNAHKGIGCRG